MNVRRRCVGRIGAAILGVLALTLTACGGGSEDTSAGLTGEPIKIGYGTPFSGPYAWSESTLAMLPAWSRWVNENGGINGRPVEVVIRDTRADAATAQSEVRDLIESEGVVAMIIVDATAEAATAEYITGQGVPLLGIGYNDKIYSAMPLVMSQTYTIPAGVQGQVLPAKVLGKDRFGVIACSHSPACEQLRAVYDSAAKAEGMTYTGLVGVQAAAPSYTATCLQFIQSGTNYLNLQVANETVEPIVRDCVRQGYDGTFGVAGHTAKLDVYDHLEGTSWGASSKAFPGGRKLRPCGSTGRSWSDTRPTPTTGIPTRPRPGRSSSSSGRPSEGSRGRSPRSRWWRPTRPSRTRRSAGSCPSR